MLRHQNSQGKAPIYRPPCKMLQRPKMFGRTHQKSTTLAVLGYTNPAKCLARKGTGFDIHPFHKMALTQSTTSASHQRRPVMLSAYINHHSQIAACQPPNRSLTNPASYLSLALRQFVRSQPSSATSM
eukprot:jgi/Botrbrau1/4968/Bobra.0122s0043.1